MKINKKIYLLILKFLDLFLKIFAAKLISLLNK